MRLKQTIPRNLAFWDIEGRSRADLRRVTGPNYAECPSTEITCSVWFSENTLYVWYPFIDTILPSDVEYINNVIERVVEDSEHYVALNEPEMRFFTGPEGLAEVVPLIKGVWAAHNGWAFDDYVWKNKVSEDLQPEETLDTMPHRS